MIGSPETQRKGESSGAPLTTNYRSIARSFFLRVCVAVTLALILVVGVELFTYWRGVENQHTIGPEVDAAVVEGTPEEREYWKEQQPAQRVQYEPYVLWRRAPFNGSAISIDADASAAPSTTTATQRLSRCGCSETPSCGAGAVPTRRQFHRWWPQITKKLASKSAS